MAPFHKNVLERTLTIGLRVLRSSTGCSGQVKTDTGLSYGGFKGLNRACSPKSGPIYFALSVRSKVPGLTRLTNAFPFLFFICLTIVASIPLLFTGLSGVPLIRLA